MVQAEIRIGLVLYGGVSLAVYETGVTRTFYELVTARSRKSGGAYLLLDLLEADAVVDTISGTSAGGINGMLLAAALESGADFANATDLWLRNADLGELLRRPASTHEPRSILDGEGYYQEKLIDAFKSVLKREPGYAGYKSEIDVFVTSTDLGGSVHDVRIHHDPLDDGEGVVRVPVRDRTHRVVFQLKHRLNERARLGVLRSVPPALRDDVQTMTLAAIARATSAFPVAFPPFHSGQLANLGMSDTVLKEVERSLHLLATHPRVGGACEHPRDAEHVPYLVDGGVLDNKPFGPLLRAIFYRMPSGPVDRRVFFVEPDPTSERDDRLDEPTPAQVALAALTTVPAHESILEDVAALEAHNGRVKWLKAQRAAVGRQPGAESDPATARTYFQARVQSLAKSIILAARDGVPSAEDVPAPRHRQLFDSVVQELESKTRHELDRLDVDYHLRRALYVLYAVYGERGDAPATLLRAVGRIIETLQVIKAGLTQERRRLLKGAEVAVELLGALEASLAADRPVWSELKRLDVALETPAGRSSVLASLEAVRLDSMLSAVGQDPSPPTTSSAQPARSTALQVVEQTLRVVAEREFDSFAFVDEHLFPAEYLTGIHELDEFELVRISPRDAQLGLSKLEDRADPMVKLTGDGLGHFAGFLRSDWRANDMLWGRVDGIAQVVAALLDQGTRLRLASSTETPNKLKELFSGAAVARAMPLVVDAESLTKAAHALADALPTPGDHDVEWRAFRENLALAMQRQAVAEDMERLQTEVAYQEGAWGQRTLAGGVSSEAARRETERSARTAAVAWLATERDRKGYEVGRTFQELKIGKETVGSRVPLHVLGEYVAHAYVLLWGMLDWSLTRRGVTVLQEPPLRVAFRTPVRAALSIFGLMRTDRRAAAVLSATALGITSGALGMTLLAHDSPKALLVSGGAFMLTSTVIVVFGPSQRARNKPPTGLRRVAVAVGWTLIAVAGAWLVLLIGALVRGWGPMNQVATWIERAFF